MSKFPKRNQLGVYQSRDGGLEIKTKIEKNTVWLSLDNIALLFGRDKSVVSRHIKNIFLTDELSRNSVVAKNATTAVDGKTYMVEYFNLDLIISVGYRINSKQATAFRIWATKTLKEHLLKGYTINQKLLLSQRSKFKELQTTIDYLENQAKHELLRGQGQELLSLVRDYTKSLHLLEDYDSKKIKTSRGSKLISKLNIAWAEEVIGGIKKNLTDTGRQVCWFRDKCCGFY